MNTKLNLISEINTDESVIYLINDVNFLEQGSFSNSEFEYIKRCIKDGDKQILINSYSKLSVVQLIEDEKDSDRLKEILRNNANEIYSSLQKHKEKSIIINSDTNPENTIVFTEGLLLSTYRFLHHFSDKQKKENNLEAINIQHSEITEAQLNELEKLTRAVFLSRNLVNEPVSHMNTSIFCEEIIKAGKEFGFDVDIMHKDKIEALKMGGLLAVNKGSVDPPAFAVLEWNPENAKNKKPLILVGKGIVYDTGGLNIKTGDYMSDMKSDMGGAATVAGAFAAFAQNEVSAHIIGLIPITDNRPGYNAYAPGDILKMHNGKTVEVLNTDAEGRLALADALSFAQKYDPELVIDFATLTGSAAIALGAQGAVMMGNADNSIKSNLIKSGNESFERMVEFPFWDEYKKFLESDVADLTNLGGREGGAITAGKFLEHFTNYPYIHIDIAGTAFLTKPNTYRPKGASGFGVRMIYNYVKQNY